MIRLLSTAASAFHLPGAEVAEQLDGAQTTPPRLTLVPNESVPTPIETESEGRAVERLLAAVAAEQVWEGEGGFTP
jgi:hypothetical protein